MADDRTREFPTQSGFWAVISLADDLAGMGGIFMSEKQFISRIGKKLTEQAVTQILRPTGGN
ncbi:MAG TPA: hypothetical protein VGN72_09550 [Tepidisphaeraceae bacterium]|jgi:hypothetical protein|nr:hypothetical protein [Tepidisphaeraceae bacterium]